MDEIARLVEKRRAEASRKEIASKAMIILKSYGQSIRDEGSSVGEFGCLTQNTFLPWRDDALSEGQDDRFLATTPVDADDDGHTHVIGKIYDGLMSGRNFEVRLMSHHAELRVVWHGKVVFREVAGSLDAYSPGEDTWEPVLESLSASGTRKLLSLRPHQEAAEARRRAGLAKSAFQKLRELWGV